MRRRWGWRGWRKLGAALAGSGRHCGASLRRRPCAWLILLAVFLSSCQAPPAQLHGSPYAAPAPAAEIRAPQTGGGTFQLTALNGRPRLLFFGYTSCPDVCPLTLGKLAGIFEELGSRADKIPVIFVTVDPRIDSLEVLETYLAGFDAGFIGLRLEGPELETLMAAYGVHAVQEADDEHSSLVAHTARIFLISAEGNLLTNYDLSVPADEILEDLRLLLDA